MWSNKGQTNSPLYKKRAYIVDRAEAAMANLAQVGEDLLRIFLIKILRNLGVLQVARPAEGNGDGDDVRVKEGKTENKKEEETQKRTRFSNKCKGKQKDRPPMLALCRCRLLCRSCRRRTAALLTVDRKR